MTTPLHTRVGQLVRLLSSDVIGEAGAAAQALHRTLAAAGIDIHKFAEIVEAALMEPPPAKKIDSLEWVDVDVLTLHRHQKPGRGRPVVRVQYKVGASSFFDWWAFEHDGYAKDIAREKWRCLGGDLPPPRTVNEAIERQDELDPDLEIQVRLDGRYWSVTGQRQRCGVAA